MEDHDYDLRSRYVRIFLVDAIYWLISIGTAFVNETLLSNKTMAYNTPLFITWFQCIVSFTICFCMSLSGSIPEGTPWDIENFKMVTPITVMYSLMIATNSLCLNYGVSFYSIGSSLTTVFIVVLSWTLLDQMTSVMCKSCCLFIVFGFCLGVDREKLDTFSLIGVMYGVLGSLTLALYSIYIKIVLADVQEIWLLLYYNSAYLIILFIPLILASGELAILWNYTIFEIVEWLDLYFWVEMAVGGFCRLIIGYITILQIKITSPLTHNISDTAKTCVQMIIATYWYNKPKNGLWWSSNLAIISSCAIYAQFKHIEMEDNARKPQPEEEHSLI